MKNFKREKYKLIEFSQTWSLNNFTTSNIKNIMKNLEKKNLMNKKFIKRVLKNNEIIENNENENNYNDFQNISYNNL